MQMRNLRLIRGVLLKRWGVKPKDSRSFCEKIWLCFSRDQCIDVGFIHIAFPRQSGGIQSVSAKGLAPEVGKIIFEWCRIREPTHFSRGTHLIVNVRPLPEVHVALRLE